MQILADLLNTIPAIDLAAMSRAQRHIDGLLKPVGSLGRLEALAIQLAGMPGLNGIPHVGKKAVLVMCADHGVWEEGVAISPKEVTAIQAENMTRGTTGVCVLAAQAGANVHVIDVGIDTAEPIPGLINMRVARGSGNIASAPAMSRRQAEKLLLDVICYTRELAKNGVTLFGVGELGMANTTPAAAIVSTITGRDPEEVVGIGANLPTDKLANKIDVVRRAITLNQPNPQDGVNVLAKVGGFRFGRNSWSDVRCCFLRFTRVAGWISFLCCCARSLPDVSCNQTVSHSFSLVGRKRRAYSALAFGAGALSQYGYALGEGSGAAGDVHHRSCLCDIQQHGRTCCQ